MSQSVSSIEGSMQPTALGCLQGRAAGPRVKGWVFATCLCHRRGVLVNLRERFGCNTNCLLPTPKMNPSTALSLQLATFDRTKFSRNQIRIPSCTSFWVQLHHHLLHSSRQLPREFHPSVPKMEPWLHPVQLGRPALPQNHCPDATKKDVVRL